MTRHRDFIDQSRQKSEFNTTNLCDTTHFDFQDDYHTGGVKKGGFTMGN